MTPIEAMAKAYEREMSRWHWDFTVGQRQIKIIRSGDDAEEIMHQCISEGYISSDQIDMLMESFQQPASARAALLALAECDLPAELFDAATQAETDVRNSKKLEKRFKFLLRSIANTDQPA